MNFEAAFKDLQSLVNKMEQGGMSLEEALKNFEQGIKLTQQCQKALKQAEQKVSILVEKNGLHHLEDFQEENDAE